MDQLPSFEHEPESWPNRGVDLAGTRPPRAGLVALPGIAVAEAHRIWSGAKQNGLLADEFDCSPV
ncbi:MAG: hypothetical protein ACK557_17785 [Planctomycetota bacterium]